MAKSNIHHLTTTEFIVKVASAVSALNTHLLRPPHLLRSPHLPRPSSPAPPILTFFFSRYLMHSSELLVQAYIRGVSPAVSVWVEENVGKVSSRALAQGQVLKGFSTRTGPQGL